MQNMPNMLNTQGSLLIPKMEFFYKSSYLRFELFISGLEGLEGAW